MKIKFTVNRTKVELDVEPTMSLLQVLREQLFLTGTKEGCGEGECGACTVLLNGDAVDSCLVPVGQVDGQKVETIEGLSENGKLHPIQEAFVREGAVQCGFCTPGMVMSAKALLDKKKKPTADEIKEAISGNVCRCTGYTKIIDAVQKAAIKMRRVKTKR